jgi:hypothetical protein
MNCRDYLESCQGSQYSTSYHGNLELFQARQLTKCYPDCLW